MGWTYNAPEGTATSGPRIAAIVLTFTSVALLIVCARLYVRAWMIKAMGYDDSVIIVAWLGACAYTTTTVIQTKWGLGITSLDDMPPENIYNFGLAQYIGAPFYVLGIWGFKTSLLLSYLRFIPIQGYRIAIIVIGVVVAVAHIGFICSFLFLCTPIAKQWDLSITDRHCGEGVSFYLTFSALTIIFDMIVFVLPFPVLVKSNIQLRRKIALLCLFALGIFVTVIQVIRIHTIKNLSNYLNSSNPILWSIIENDIGIIIASVPTLAPLVKYYSERSRNASGNDLQPPEPQYGLQSRRSANNKYSSGDAVRESSDEHDAPKKYTDSTEHII
ncbi:hypothetical protein TOPH_08210 [Tolypocladium ophioglossoides CBS 100239]|uniref:Rhodopsin domain-containing protein n=1 Tax=Tolypocladium ophioglossoides (strain CBS 100239) TaxID=1163406 RepID=A0A0L0N039_TOLOC|nr:hypothetical protein TOPH_08210 [Tolypocladium ophioglossoides CBS 100239]